jgi:hypothetical protein
MTLTNPVSGAATLIVADPVGHQIASVTVLLTRGQASTTIVPRGARGPHSANLMLSNGRIIAATPALYTYEPQTVVSTGIERYDQFIPAATTIMRGAILDQPFGAGTVHGYRSPDSPLIWLRDHVYQMQGARYFDGDMTSAIDAFASLQYPDGSFPDFLPRAPWADTAYRSQAHETWLQRQGRVSRIHRKKPKGKPMPERMAKANAAKSKIRARVEHVFAQQKAKMGPFIRTIGLKRAEAKITLANLAYNMNRLIFHERPLATP